MNQNTVQITLQFKDDGTIAVVDQAKGKIKDLNKTVDDSKGTLATAQEGWGLITMKVAAASAAFYAAKRIIYDNAVQIASATNAIERQAAVLGIGTDELQKWQYAAKRSDVNAQELAIGIKLLSRNMVDASSGAGESAKYFSAMGVSVKDAHGNLRPLNDVMGDIMDKFASWEDGPRKIAIAMQIFGRSGETLIPLLNKGKIGFSEFAEEARKLGIILSPDLIRKGSEAEDIFKKINAQVEAGKLKFAPYALEVAKGANLFLESLNKVKDWVKDNPQVWDYIVGAIPGGQGMRRLGDAAYLREQAKRLTAEGMMAWEPGPTPISKTGKPPIVEDTAKKLKEYYDSQKPYYESLGKKGDELERGAYGGMEEGGFWQTLKDQKEIQENLHGIEMERAEQLANDMFPAEDKVRAITEKMTEGAEKLRLQLVEMRGLVTDFGWEDYAAGADAASEGTRKVNQMMIENTKNAEKMQEQNKVWQDIGTGIADIWSSNFSRMRRSGEDFSEWFKKLWLDMADYAIGQIAKIAMNYAIFGNTKGTYSSGSGLIGLVGSLFRLAEGGQLPGPFIPIKAFQGGGYVDRPTLGLIGEGGEGEYIIPESKMGRRPEGGDTTIIMYVEATDVDSFERKYGSSVTKIIHRNKKSGGMRN